MNEMPKTHVCLVSDQAIPNITPALDSRLAPERVVLVVSGKTMEERAERLTEILTLHGMIVEVELLRSHEDFAMLREDFRRIALACPDAALNATGGKKTMTLAAYEAFIGEGRPVFYVEQDNTLQWLANQTGKIELEANLGLKDMLDAHSQKIDFLETGAHPYKVKLAARYFSDQEKFGPVLAELLFNGKTVNKVVTRKDGKGLGPHHVEAIKAAVPAGLTKNIDGIWHATAEGARFLSGGWLELHVFNTVKGLADRLGIKDVCYGLKISSLISKEISNEIDVAFVRKNKLHIIECKALKSGSRSKSAADFIYTLESVRKHGGLTAKAALLTWGGGPGPTDRTRAENNRIRVLSGPTLSDLDLAISLWTDSK